MNIHEIAEQQTELSTMYLEHIMKMQDIVLKVSSKEMDAIEGIRVISGLIGSAGCCYDEIMQDDTEPYERDLTTDNAQDS